MLVATGEACYVGEIARSRLARNAHLNNAPGDAKGIASIEIEKSKTWELISNTLTMKWSFLWHRDSKYRENDMEEHNHARFPLDSFIL